MRNRSEVYCGLDIQSDKIFAVCGLFDNKDEKFIDISCQSGPARGIKNGKISELGLLAESVSRVLNSFGANASGRIKSLYVSTYSSSLKASQSVGTIPVSERSSKIITSGDISKANHQAYCLGLNIEERVLHQVIQGYVIDKQNRVLNPLGLYGHTLEADTLLITALVQDTDSLISAVERSGFKVKSLVLAGYAAGLVLPDSLRMKGCCLFEIGFDSTQMLIFKEGIIRGFEAFPFGSNDVTEAIAKELKVPLDTALALKLSHGNIIPNSVNPDTEVLLKKEQSYRPLKRQVLCEIIERKWREFFGLAKERLVGYQQGLGLPEGIVVSGRDVLLEGLLESFEANLGMPSRLAKMENPSLDDPSYFVSAGLLKYALLQRPPFNILKLSSYGNIFQKITNKSRELYQEYF
ncbi:MAG: cell division protein FtsA [Candidatus Omnitrophota bacterium]